MYLDLNIFDETVVNTLLNLCPFSKNMTITELLEIIDYNNLNYCTTYLHNTLYIEQINGTQVNVSIKQNKIFIVLQNNKGNKTSVSYNLDPENNTIGQIHVLLLKKFNSKYKNLDTDLLWRMIDITSDLESIEYICDSITFTHNLEQLKNIFETN